MIKNIYFFKGRVSLLHIFALLIVAGLLISAYIVLGTDILIEKDLLEHPPASRCSECHKKIYDQWKKSRHSMAWISEGYKKETEQYKKQKCMGCHNPLVISFDSKPQQRDFHLDDGVSCLGCHFRENKMFGPYDVWSPVHPTQINRGYHDAGFCKGCHIKTYEEWEKTGNFTTCQKCHMKTERSKMIDKFPFYLLPVHFTVDLGDHTLPPLTIKEDELQFEFKTTSDELTVTINNIGIPHDIPTAQNGDPRIYLEITFLTESESVIEKDRITFAPQLDTALSYKKPWEEFYPIPEGCATIRLSLHLKRPWEDEKELIIARELKV